MGCLRGERRWRKLGATIENSRQVGHFLFFFIEEAWKGGKRNGRVGLRKPPATTMKKGQENYSDS